MVAILFFILMQLTFIWKSICTYSVTALLTTNLTTHKQTVSHTWADANITYCDNPQRDRILNGIVSNGQILTMELIILPVVVTKSGLKSKKCDIFGVPRLNLSNFSFDRFYRINLSTFNSSNIYFILPNLSNLSFNKSN